MSISVMQWLRILGVIVVLVVLGITIWCGWSLLQANEPGKGLSSDFRWAMLPVISAIGLVLVLLVLSTVISFLGLGDKTQALGLPEGSIRAVLALILLAMFIIVPLSLYNSVGGEFKTIEHISEAGLRDFKSNASAQYVSSFRTVEPSAGPPAAAAQYTVIYRDARGRDDFAKTILTALITLVTSVCSFYFAASTLRSAQATAFSQTQSLMQSNATTIELKGIQGRGQNILAWSVFPGAISYNVYRAEASGGQTSVPLQAHVALTTFTDTGLTAGKTYFYKVTASLASGESTPSNEVSLTPS